MTSEDSRAPRNLRRTGVIAIGLLLLACNTRPVSMSERGTNAPPAVVAPAASASSIASTRAHELIRVEDPSTVCMVNNRFMGDKQIPVIVDGKTYFGCCEMCKARLEHDQTARMATDPVSGHSIDKASAVIGRDTTNKVFYFENEATFRQAGGAS